MRERIFFKVDDYDGGIACIVWYRQSVPDQEIMQKTKFELFSSKVNAQVNSVYLPSVRKVQIFAGGWRHPPVETATGLCLTDRKIMHRRRF